MTGFDLDRAGPLRQVVRRIFAKDSPLSLPARAVAVVLADHANAEGIAWPSYEKIAERTGLGRSTVARAIDALTSGSSPVFAKRRRGRSNAYEVVRSPAAFVEGRDQSRTVPERDSKTVPGALGEPSRNGTPTSPAAGLLPVPERDSKRIREENQGRENSPPSPPPGGRPAHGEEGTPTPDPNPVDRSPEAVRARSLAAQKDADRRRRDADRNGSRVVGSELRGDDGFVFGPEEVAELRRRMESPRGAQP
jgi:hypothetical protein